MNATAARSTQDAGIVHENVAHGVDQQHLSGWITTVYKALEATAGLDISDISTSESSSNITRVWTSAVDHSHTQTHRHIDT